MVIAFPESIQEQHPLHLKLNISTTLGITAQEAHSKVLRYFVDHVNMFITPRPPLLVMLDDHTFHWRFPLVFSLGRQGRLGQVGEVDVDAYTGELLIQETQVQEINANVRRLAQSTPHSSEQ